MQCASVAMLSQGDVAIRRRFYKTPLYEVVNSHLVLLVQLSEDCLVSGKTRNFAEHIRLDLDAYR